jgi:hypothetical protein
MSEVKIIERPGTVHKSLLGTKQKVQNIAYRTDIIYWDKSTKSCVFADEGETWNCKHPNCRTCSQAVINVIRAGHIHTDTEFDERDFRVKELEKDNAKLQMEKDALFEKLAKMETKGP